MIEKINKLDKPLSGSSRKKKSDKNQVNKIRNKNGEITIHNTELQKTIRDYYEHLYANKIDKLEEIDKFHSLEQIVSSRLSLELHIVEFTVPHLKNSKTMHG